MSPSTATPPENDLMDTNAPSQKGSCSPPADAIGREATDNANVPKPKRLACMICRRRKLKCDGVRPSCSTCSRLGHTCAYDEVRRKSGPKRGYVKALEERLSEQLLSLSPSVSVILTRGLRTGRDAVEDAGAGRRRRGCFEARTPVPREWGWSWPGPGPYTELHRRKPDSGSPRRSGYGPVAV